MTGHWILIRRPLGVDTVAKNVQTWGTGGLNIDASRISAQGKIIDDGKGRFPSNVVFSHHPECELVGEKVVKSHNPGNNKPSPTIASTYGEYKTLGRSLVGHAKDGKETVPNWNCHEDCAVKKLDEQSGVSPSNKRKSKGPVDSAPGLLGWKRGRNNSVDDKGGVSRFFKQFSTKEQPETEAILGKYKIVKGDCIVALKAIPDISIDSIVTDPPAGISFMGKSWDDDKGGRDEWIAWMASIATEIHRVLKPGGHGLVWALPRTSHWTATAFENAGFEIRDVVNHIFGTGFPKSQDISKAMDKSFEQIDGDRMIAQTIHAVCTVCGKRAYSGNPCQCPDPSKDAVTPEAKKWQGFGTALKPAAENWIMVRRPLAASTVAKNVQTWGTGGLNIDASRIGTEERENGQKDTTAWHGNNWSGSPQKSNGEVKKVQGRFPSNVVFSHHPECELVGEKEVKAIKSGVTESTDPKGWKNTSSKVLQYGHGVDGKETVPDWNCHKSCAVKELDGQSGVLKNGGQNYEGGSRNSMFGNAAVVNQTAFAGDKGGASRFFMAFSTSCGQENIKTEDMCAGKNLANKKENLNTDISGSKRTEKYLLIAISITKMETLSTMTFQILNASTNTTIGIFIIETENNIESLMGQHIESVSVASNTEVSITSKNDQVVHFRGTVSIALEKNLQNGERKIENTTTNICLTTEKLIEKEFLRLKESLDLNRNDRFFYCSKASKADRNAGLEHLEPKKSEYRKNDDSKKNTIRERLHGSCPKLNHHPTVKNTELMKYLIRLVTPPNGVVLNPFMGSGSTGVAALKTGFNFYGVELEPEYFEIAKARLKALVT